MKRSLAVAPVLAAGVVCALLVPQPASAKAPGAAAVPGAGAVAAAASHLPPLRPGDWLMYRDRDAHGGWNAAESVLSTADVASLAPAFSFAAATGQLPEQLGAVGHGLLFVPAAHGGLSALDATTGTWRWSAPAAGTEVALGGDAVYTVTAAGTVDVLAAATGKTRWQLAVPGSWVATYGAALRPPSLSGGCLLVSGVQRYQLSPTVQQQRVVVDCVSLSTRSVLWSTIVSDPGLAVGAPSTDGHSVYVATNGRTVSALSLASGAVEWQTTVSGSGENSTPMPSPVVRDGQVLVGFAGGTFRAFSATTGTQVWSQQVCSTTSAIFATAGSADGVAYVACLTYADQVAHDLVAVSEADGHVVWSVRSNVDNSPPTVANGVVYVGTTATGSNGLAMYDAADGTLLASVTIPGPGGYTDAVTEPVVSHGHVYVGTSTAGTALALP